MPQAEPMVLLDATDDWPETCWVEATVGDEDAARDAAAPSCAGEDNETPFRPVGPAVREWHRETDRMTPDGQVWEKCKSDDPGAIEFWAVSVF
jgi:hypothetical protein